MKQLYVALVRTARRLLHFCGADRALETWSQRSRTGLWARSLLSIYDLEDLLELDVPWWTFDAVGRVEEFLARRPDARVFEWGSGASTVWLSRRAGSVASVEHDPGWAEQVRPCLPANAQLVVVAPEKARAGGGVRSGKPGFEGLDFSEYVAAIDAVPGDFDLVVIDGRAREACLPRAAARLAEGGLIVFDNARRRRYRSAISTLTDAWEVCWTSGLTPCLPYPDHTALIGATGRVGR